MEQVEEFGAFYAKTHFSELLAQVAEGGKFLISRHGHTVAMLIPFMKNASDEKELAISSAIRAIRNLRDGTKLGKNLSIKEMRSQGRA